MNYTPKEREKLKAVIMYLIKAKDKRSDGKCGFRLLELQEIFDELEQEGKIKLRASHQSNLYTLNTNNNE